MTTTDPIRAQYMRDNAPDRPALRALNEAAWAAVREAKGFPGLNAIHRIAIEIDQIVDAL